MNKKNSFSDSESDSENVDFTLKLSSSGTSESESGTFKLEVSSDEEDCNNNYCKSSKEDGNQSSKVRIIDNRVLSPTFNIKIIPKTDRSQLLDYKLQLSYSKVEAYLRKESFSNSINTNDEDNCSSSESELELHTFKKRNNQTNKELFSSEEESLMEYSKNSCSAFKKPDDVKRRITRSESLKRKQLLQKQTLEMLKEKRSQKIKILVPFVSSCVPSSTRSKKSLKEKLRQMKLFRFL